MSVTGVEAQIARWKRRKETADKRKDREEKRTEQREIDGPDGDDMEQQEIDGDGDGMEQREIDGDSSAAWFCNSCSLNVFYLRILSSLHCSFHAKIINFHNRCWSTYFRGGGWVQILQSIWTPWGSTFFRGSPNTLVLL